MPDSRAGVLGVPGIFMQSDLAWKCSYFIDLLVGALHKTILTISTKNNAPLVNGQAVEENEGLRPRILWTKTSCIFYV